MLELEIPTRRNDQSPLGGQAKAPSFGYNIRVYGYPNYPPRPPAPPPSGPSPLLIALIVAGGLAVLGIGGAVVAVLFVAAVSTSEAATAEPPPVVSASSAPTPAKAAVTLDEGNDEGPADDDPAPEGANADPSSGAKGANAAPSNGAGGKWFCSASASVRVCGFAGACNYQMVFGNGVGNDRFSAHTMAKNACEGSARARGAAAVCVVQCTVR